MTRRLEDWQLDMLLGGDGTPEMDAILASSPADQARFAQLRGEEAKLFDQLFRVECPTSLLLGEWHLGLLDKTTSQMISNHIDLCSECENELVVMAEMLDQPLFQTASKHTFQQKRGFGLLKRIVMTLEQALSNIGTQSAPVALRGDSWNAYYSGGDYLLSLTRQEQEQGSALIGSILADSVAGQATLKEESGLIYEAPITDSATFSFDGVTPGEYELVITTQETQLVVPQLHWHS